MLTKTNRPVVLWLGTVLGMVLAMVVIGGITRLTGSGLSMVDWHPLMGALPPMGDDAWQAVFARYQTSPQYQQVNQWMQLGDFQRIFLWEFMHRVLGRLIGVVFFVPFVVFAIQRRFDARLGLRVGIAFVLGGAQGLLGWFMVKSGLVDVPEVSHLRLAAHLSLAFFVGMYLLWLILDLVTGDDDAGGGSAPSGSRAAVWGLIALVSVQVVYGAFMAGKRAGLLFSTFPDMNGSYWPSVEHPEGFIAGLVDNPVLIHATHRALAWVVLFAVLGLVVALRGAAVSQRAKTTLRMVAAAVGLQFLLGVFTVVYSVPIVVAVAHQAGAFVLLGALVALAHALARPRA